MEKEKNKGWKRGQINDEIIYGTLYFNMCFDLLFLIDGHVINKS